MSGTIELSRELPASPVRVFRAWTDPGLMAQWISGHARVELDPRPGGRLMVDMREADRSHIHEGEYTEVRPPEGEREQTAVLAFTWRSEATDGEETRIRLEITGSRKRSRLVLVHEGLSEGAMVEDHRAGWGEILDTLADYLSL